MGVPHSGQGQEEVVRDMRGLSRSSALVVFPVEDDDDDEEEEVVAGE